MASTPRGPAANALPTLSLAVAALLFTPTPPCPAGTFSGAVLDSTTGSPIEGARVLVSQADGLPVSGALTNAVGAYRIVLGEAGRFLIQAARVGYEGARRGPFVLGLADTLRCDFTLAPGAVRLDPVVVTVSRRAERSGNAPASVSVVTRRAIEGRPAVTPVAHLRSVAGLDVAATGLTQSSVVARGFGSAQSSALLPLVDYRYANLPALRYALLHFLPTPDEDMERIEVLRGPGAAVYGPNSDRGVVHVITRSPFEGPGFTGTFTGGEREIAQGSFRHARRWSDRWAAKVTGQYFRGREWPERDSVETAGREQALGAGADSATLLVGRRETRNEAVAGEASLEWRGAAGTGATLSAGHHRAVRSIDLTALGAAQVRDWASTYVQVRGNRGGFFGQAFVNASDAGDTYLLRSGAPIRDRSRLYSVQAQQAWAGGARIRLTVGADAEWTDPKTERTISGRNEDRDHVRESGLYGYASIALGGGLTAVTAIRLDDHDRLDGIVLSPRAALTLEPAAGQHLRVTYNRAFGTPAVDDLFADLVVDSLPLPFAVRVSGVPAGGFHFPRDTGSPLMRSPFTGPADGGPNAYRPLDATLYWDTVVALLQGGGFDLSSVAAPTSADVGTTLRTIEADGSIHPVSDVSDLPGLEPTITNSAELGYRGLLGGRLRLGIDVYRTWIENFIGHLHTITPNAFLDPATLAAYLVSQGLTPAEAQAASEAAAEIPVGTVTPIESPDAADIILAVENFGSVAVWGSDLSAALSLGARVTIGGNFSWVSEDLFHRLDGATDLALNAPGRKGSASLAYRDSDRGITGEARYRGASSYPVLSGVYAGEVESFSVVDFGAGFRIGHVPETTVTITVENAIGRAHREFLGAPRIGRLALARLRVGF